jgi:hypothetical protein
LSAVSAPVFAKFFATESKGEQESQKEEKNVCFCLQGGRVFFLLHLLVARE